MPNAFFLTRRAVSGIIICISERPCCHFPPYLCSNRCVWLRHQLWRYYKGSVHGNASYPSFWPNISPLLCTLIYQTCYPSTWTCRGPAWWSESHDNENSDFVNVLRLYMPSVIYTKGTRLLKLLLLLLHPRLLQSNINRFKIQKTLDSNEGDFSPPTLQTIYFWLSVRPPVTPFSLCSHHRIIMKFSGVITNDWSDVHEKDQGQRSMVKVTEVQTHYLGQKIADFDPIWAFPDCNSSLNSPMTLKWCTELNII